MIFPLTIMAPDSAVVKNNGLIGEKGCVDQSRR